MKKFSDFLAELDTTDQIQKIELVNAAGVVVGLIENPTSVMTGPKSFQTRCTFVFGTRLSTWAGPVRSSCVKLGNRRKPTSMFIFILAR